MKSFLMVALQVLVAASPGFVQVVADAELDLLRQAPAPAPIPAVIARYIRYTYTVTAHTHCGGKSIQKWESGGDTNYGLGFANNIDGCKATCSAHDDCAGFISRDNDNQCAFWKAGPLKPYDRDLHHCYKKQESVFEMDYSKFWRDIMEKAFSDRGITSPDGVKVVGLNGEEFELKFVDGIPVLKPFPQAEDFPLQIVRGMNDGSDRPAPMLGPELPFTVGRFGENGCGAHLTSAECRTIAAAQGLPFNRDDTWSDYPKGCFWNHNDQFYFNEHATGAPNSGPGAKPVCKPFKLNFTVGQFGENGCDVHLTSAECRAIAAAQGLPFNRDHIWSDYPKGCFWNHNDQFYFNEHATGAPNSDPGAKPVCKPFKPGDPLTKVKSPWHAGGSVEPRGGAVLPPDYAGFGGTKDVPQTEWAPAVSVKFSLDNINYCYLQSKDESLMKLPLDFLSLHNKGLLADVDNSDTTSEDDDADDDEDSARDGDEANAIEVVDPRYRRSIDKKRMTANQAEPKPVRRVRGHRHGKTPQEAGMAPEGLAPPEEQPMKFMLRGGNKTKDEEHKTQEEEEAAATKKQEEADKEKMRELDAAQKERMRERDERDKAAARSKKREKVDRKLDKENDDSEAKPFHSKKKNYKKPYCVVYYIDRQGKGNGEPEGAMYVSKLAAQVKFDQLYEGRFPAIELDSKMREMRRYGSMGDEKWKLLKDWCKVAFDGWYSSVADQAGMTNRQMLEEAIRTAFEKSMDDLKFPWKRLQGAGLQKHPYHLNVSFFPGETRHFASCDGRDFSRNNEDFSTPHEDGLMTTTVGVDIIQEPKMQGFLPMIYKDLLEDVESKLLNNHLKKQVEKATGFHPVISWKGGGVNYTSIPAWNIAVCSIHMKYLVQRFEKTYTRERTPNALYDECTVFASASSFSHDLVVDEQDRQKCRNTVVNFLKKWDYGQGDISYVSLCKEICQLKYSPWSFQCNPDLIPGLE